MKPRGYGPELWRRLAEMGAVGLTLSAYFSSIDGGADQIHHNIIGERVGLPKEPEVDREVPFHQVGGV